MQLLNLIKRIWSKITLDRAIKRLIKVQKDTGLQIKGFTLSPGSKLTPTQGVNALAGITEDYSNYKKGLPTKRTFKEVIIPEDFEMEQQ